MNSWATTWPARVRAHVRIRVRAHFIVVVVVASLVRKIEGSEIENGGGAEAPSNFQFLRSPILVLAAERGEIQLGLRPPIEFLPSNGFLN